MALASPEDRPVRVLPHNADLEQALLGALLVNNGALDAVPDGLSPDDFHHPVHGRIFAAIRERVTTGGIADAFTLMLSFRDDPALRDIGGSDYLARLAGSAVSIVAAPDYARVILDLGRRRRLIAEAEAAIAAAYDFQDQRPAADMIEALEGRLAGLADEGHAADARPWPATLDAAVRQAEAAYQKRGAVAGVTTGFAALDALTGGMEAGELAILAGRPGMGKTALATCIAIAAARAGHAVAYFSLEMAAAQIAQRALAVDGQVGPHDMRRGTLHPREFHRMLDSRTRLAPLPIWVDGTPALTVAQIRARARRALRRLKPTRPALVVIDHLGLVTDPAEAQRRSTVDRIGERTAGLRAMAKQIGCACLCLHQLSRAVEAREDKRPQLSDLRDSGAIEQDADAVLFVYRDDYYIARSRPRGDGQRAAWEARLAEAKGKVELIVAKQRNGPVGSVALRFDERSTAFHDGPAEADAGQEAML